MTIKEIRKHTGLSQVKFAEYYNIPRRTIEAWESGNREPADYLVSLLWRAVKEDFNIDESLSKCQALFLFP